MTGRPGRVYKAECIVLGRRNLGEGDSIFTLFSPVLGRFDAVAKGVRKPRSHMRGHLEPLARVDVLVAKGRSLDVLTQAQVIDPFQHIREDLDRTAVALYAVDLVRRFSPERDPLPAVYELAVALLELLDQGARLSTLRAFEVQLLMVSGFALSLDSCGVCGGQLPERDTFFGAATNGLLCPQCRPDAGPGRLLSVRAVKVLRYAARTELSAFAALRIEKPDDTEVAAAMADVLRFVLDDEPRAARFMHEVQALYRSENAAGDSRVESI